MKELFNFNHMSKCVVAFNKENGKIAVVFFTDFSFENAAEFTLNTVKRVGAKAVEKYLKYDEIVAFDGHIVKKSDKYYDKTATYIEVGPDGMERRKFLILGLPGSCKDWFENEEKFNEFIELCPFDIMLIELK